MNPASTDELNNVLWVDGDTTDIGTELNLLNSSASAGDRIRVPPSSYTAGETIGLDMAVAVGSPTSFTSRRGNNSFIEIQNDTGD